MFEEEEKRPEELTVTSVVFAVGIHVAFFLVFWGAAKVLWRPREIVIPMDLTVVVHENLDGNENEPPPMEKPMPPPPPPPKPKVEPKPEPPKPVVQEKAPDAVVKVKEDKKPPKKVEEKKPDPPKKVEEKKPEPPKKTAKELREERMKEMRERATKIDPKTLPKTKETNNGKTGKKTLSDAEIAKLLQQGYKPGATEQLAGSEEARCFALIKQAIDKRWTIMSPKIGQSGSVLLCIVISRSGAISSVQLAKSCGDRISDNAAVSVVRSVGPIRGLSSSFLASYAGRSITIQYDIKGGR